MTSQDGKAELVSVPIPAIEDAPAAVAVEPASVSVPRRPRSLVVLHWLTFVCLVVAAALILVREEVDGKSLRLLLLEGHRHFGVLVLALFALRVALRLRLGKLPATGESTPMTRIAATATHVVLYVLLLIQPLLGWALSNAKGWPVHFLGATLPNLVAEDDDLADRLTILHQGAAWLLLAFVLLHVGAALWHHYVLRDNVLRAMWFERRRDRIPS